MTLCQDRNQLTLLNSRSTGDFPLDGLENGQETRGICIYCGARSGADPIYEDAARALGPALGRSGYPLIYGGGAVGMMGALANAALTAGGRVVGVIPRAMVEREWAHSGLSELIVVDTMHARKAAMASSAQCYVALPGGLGTQKNLQNPSPGRSKSRFFCSTRGYFNPLLSFVDHCIDQGFASAADRALLHTVADIDALWTHPLFPASQT